MKSRLHWSLFLGTLLLASCATTPVKDPRAAAAWLGGTPRVVVRLDATQVTAWKKLTQAKESLRPVGGRTKTVWMGFELDHLDDLKTASDTVRIVLEGDFPKALVGLALDWNNTWKKSDVPGFWTNSKLNLSVSVPEDGLVVGRRGNNFSAERSEGVLRDLNSRELQGPAVWVSFWDPGQALFGPAGARLLPVSRLDIVLNSQKDVLSGPLILWFADERSAAAATVLLKLLAPQIRARLGQDLTWSVNGLQVIGSTLTLNESDLEALANKLVADPVPAGAAP